MNVKILKEFDLGMKLGQVKSVQLHISKDEPEYILFGYSESDNIDPWEESLHFPTGRMNLALYGEQGQRIWRREFGIGVIPGTWFSPFLAFDLDNDGMDEIYFVHNTDDKRPFSVLSTVLEKIDPRDGSTMGTWPFPVKNTVMEPLTHSYRQNMTAGYANGQPVLITAQGTYGDMFLQAYNSDMSLRWERVIGADEPGPRSSHAISVFDFNEDGVDEVFWGERLISIDDGHDVVVCTDGEFRGHSDTVLPFRAPDGNMYIYTCREDKDFVGCWRVVTYDAQGNVVWRAVQSEVTGYNTNHMHIGWVMTTKPDYRKIALAVKIEPIAMHIPSETYLFDALTGEPVTYDFPIPLHKCVPVDLNGDGFHEFFAEGVLYDTDGKVLCRPGGTNMNMTKLFGYPGEQLICYYPGETKVRIWGDVDAVDSDYMKKRYENGYLKHMTQLTGSGYNSNPTVTCAM